MNFFDDLSKQYPRIGRTADKPTVPPDKSALFWDIQTGRMYAVNDAMDWVEINPPPSPYTGEMHVRIKPVVTSISPNALMWEVPLLGALIWECRLVIDSAYDVGIDLSIGDSGDNERLMKITDIDPQTTNDNFTPYKTTPMYQYSAGSGIYVYSSGVPTMGSGTLYLLYDENPNTL